MPVFESGIEGNTEGNKGTYYAIGYEETLRLARQKAGTDLNNLLRLKTELKKKYGYVLSSKPNLLY